MLLGPHTPSVNSPTDSGRTSRLLLIRIWPYEYGCFVEASVSKASLFTDLVRHAVLMEVLMKVFGYSRYFADILVREPGLFRWLTASDVLMTPVGADALSTEIRRIEDTSQGRRGGWTHSGVSTGVRFFGWEFRIFSATPISNP